MLFAPKEQGQGVLEFIIFIAVIAIILLTILNLFGVRVMSEVMSKLPF
jgi:hypothetical protein